MKKKSSAPSSSKKTDDGFVITLTLGDESYKVSGPFNPNPNEPLSVPDEICKAINELKPEAVKTFALFTLEAAGKSSTRRLMPIQARRAIVNPIAAVQLAKGLYMTLK